MINQSQPAQVWLTHTPGQHQMVRTSEHDPRAVRYVLGSDYDELIKYIAQLHEAKEVKP